MCNIRARLLWTLACLPACLLAWLGPSWLGFGVELPKRAEKQHTFKSRVFVSSFFFGSKLLFIFNIFLFSSSSDDNDAEVERKNETHFYDFSLNENICITEQIHGIGRLCFFLALILLHTHTLSLYLSLFLLLCSNSQETSLQMVTLLRESLRKWSALQMGIHCMWQPKNQTHTSNIQVNRTKKHLRRQKVLALVQFMSNISWNIFTLMITAKKKKNFLCTCARMRNPIKWKPILRD